MINGLDLFSGIGGLTLALKEWVKPKAYCEIDPYCQSVLLSRISTKQIPFAPIWDEITTFPAPIFARDIDIIYGGFPCQDVSVAGLKEGLDGKRSGLFFEIVRLAKEIQPAFIFLENVPGITLRGGIEIVKAIAEIGYGTRWCVIPASAFGAPHKRERWFLLAHANRIRFESGRKSMREEEEKPSPFRHSECPKWDKEPESKFEVDGMVHGVSGRVDAIRALGNAVVPLQAREAFRMLMGLP